MMFFSKKEVIKKELNETYSEIYLLTIKESMDYLNKTCRYQLPEETMDILPEEFDTIPSQAFPACSVAIKAGVSMTDALDAMFHDIKSDLGGPQKTIDCLMANCLVAGQAARRLFDDDEQFNAFVDARRGGRDKPIFIRSIIDQFSFDCIFQEFGIPVTKPFPHAPGKRKVLFGYMSQMDPDKYTQKHDYLTSRGFHYILLPDKSVLAFAPDVQGRFADLKNLAKYLLSEMNADLSIEEWHMHIKWLCAQLSNAGIKTDRVSHEHVFDFSSNHLPKFLTAIATINAAFPDPKAPVTVAQRIKIRAVAIEMGVQDITTQDVAFLTSLFLSLKSRLDLNDIKTPETPEVYLHMMDKATYSYCEMSTAIIPQDSYSMRL